MLKDANSSLHHTLLKNSRISGVRLKNLNTELCSVGHGIYIESIDGDRYADLRLCREKPFWGHSHPLEIHARFGSLDQSGSSGDWRLVSRVELKKYLNKASIITKSLDEDSLFTVRESPILFEGLSEVLWIKDLLLFDNSLSDMIFQNQRRLILETHYPDFIFTNFPIESHSSNSGFSNALLRYLQNILYGKDGKFEQDQKIIEKFLSMNMLENKIYQQGYYLIIDSCEHSIAQFINFGLYITQQQTRADKVVLSIPCSCTKEELLDTLDRIKQLVER